MRISRVFTEHPLQAGTTVTLDERATRYLSQVLRLRIGDDIRLFDDSGRDFAGELERCDRKVCRARITDVVSTEPAATLQLHLGIGVSRGERMDFAIQKSVELGVTAVTPLLTQRSVVELKGERLERRVAHWRGVIISACEQSGRSRLPVLYPPTALGDWLNTHRRGLMLYHEAAQTLPGLPHPGDSLNLLIGPEGGLSDTERQAAGTSGFRGVRLGPRVLRTETAPLAALAAIQALWGDFRA